MSVILSIFLGIVQGVSEFLPISSSGHLSIFQNIFNMDYSDNDHLFFHVLLHLGTLISLCVAYREDLKSMVSDTFDYLRRRAESEPDSDEPLKPTVRTVVFVLVGTIPLIPMVIFYRHLSRLFYNTGFIGIMLLITGGLLFVSDRYITTGTKRETTMTLRDAIIIGLVQAVALIPGLSRSGTTIAVGLARGLNRNFAVRFSLFLSIPAVVGAMIWELFSVIVNGFDVSLLPAYLVGFVFAAVVGYFSVQFLRRIVAKKGHFGRFAYYCWGVGALTIILSLALRA